MHGSAWTAQCWAGAGLALPVQEQLGSLGPSATPAQLSCCGCTGELSLHTKEPQAPTANKDRLSRLWGDGCPFCSAQPGGGVTAGLASLVPWALLADTALEHPQMVTPASFGRVGTCQPRLRPIKDFSHLLSLEETRDTAWSSNRVALDLGGSL